MQCQPSEFYRKCEDTHAFFSTWLYLMFDLCRRVTSYATRCSYLLRCCCAVWTSLGAGSMSTTSVSPSTQALMRLDSKTVCSGLMCACVCPSSFSQRWLQRMCWSRDDVVGRFGSPIAAYMPFITQHPDAQVGASVAKIGDSQLTAVWFF